MLTRGGVRFARTRQPGAEQVVPASTSAAETTSAYAGPTSATTTAVSSGPLTKATSIVTESSA